MLLGRPGWRWRRPLVDERGEDRTLRGGVVELPCETDGADEIDRIADDERTAAAPALEPVEEGFSGALVGDGDRAPEKGWPRRPALCSRQ